MSGEINVCCNVVTIILAECSVLGNIIISGYDGHSV